MVQPTCDTNACQRLSEDGCTCDIICGENQTCDGAGNCVEENACEEGQKVCGAAENTWCCPSDNECGTNTGECCNPSKTTCCSGDKPYAFRKKTSVCNNPTDCTITQTDTYECCLCPGDLVYNTKTGQCETCFDGEKASCTTCIKCDRYCDDWGDCIGGCLDDLRPDQSWSVSYGVGTYCSDRMEPRKYKPPYDVCPEDSPCCIAGSVVSVCCPPGSATVLRGVPQFGAFEGCHDWEHLGEEYKDVGTRYYRTCEGGVDPD